MDFWRENGHAVARPYNGIIIFVFLCVMTACANNAPAATSVPPIIPVPQAEAEILVPRTGMIIYEDTLTIRGTVTDPDEALVLQAVLATGETLLDTEIQPENGAWAYDLVHTYEGDPTELTISLLPAENGTPADYDIVSVVLSSAQYRPEGNYAEIYHPSGGEQIGGDVLIVQGVTSGYRELRLTLQDGDTIISEVPISIPDGNTLNESPWLVELPTEGTTGRVSLHLYNDNDDEPDRVDILLDDVAG